MSKFNQEELDNKIMNEIRERSENLEIPESLSPENMMKRIKEQKIKKGRFNRRIRWVTTVLAASLVLVLGVTVYNNILGKPYRIDCGIDDSTSNKDVTSNEADKDTDDATTIPAFESYEAICEELKKREIYYGYIFNSTVDAEITEEALDEDANGTSGNIKGEEGTGEEYTDTNLQVEGVDESDIIKTDGKYIYAYNTEANIIRIIKAEGENTKLESVLLLNRGETYGDGEMYLYDNKLVAIYTMLYPEDEVYVDTYDISDVTNPKKLGSVTQEGALYSSRMVDGILYLFSDRYIPYEVTEDNCVPRINNERIGCKDIYTCGAYYSVYTTMISIDINNPDKQVDVKSILTNNSYIYVSENNIYLFASSEKETGSYVKDMTDIIKIEYKNGIFNPVAEGSVEGLVRDQFSMDEYEGTLRILTTSSSYRKYNDNKLEIFVEDMIITQDTTTSNNVFVLDDKLKVIGSIKGLAKGERIYSARFDGDMGYFVTFRETDPVFAVDFSDKTNPKILGELKVSGFSEYLHMWSDNLMIGIGEEVDENTGEMLGIKISMFDVSDPENMVEVDKVILKGDYSQALYNHKALLINPEKNIIGFDVTYYNWMNDIEEFSNTYYVFSYDDEAGFTELINKKCNEEDIDFYYQTYRGVNIEDYVYIVNPRFEINVYDINRKEIIANIGF